MRMYRSARSARLQVHRPVEWQASTRHGLLDLYGMVSAIAELRLCRADLSELRASVWVAGSIAIWSIAASLLLHLAASGEKVRNAALFVNAAGIITPLVVISIAVPLGVIGGNEYRSILLDYGTICRALAVSAESWKPGDELDVASLARLVPTFQSLLSHVDRLGEFARSSYIFYAAASFVLGATIASVGGYFLFTLSRVFRQTNAVLAGSVEDGQRRVRRSLSVSSFPLCTGNSREKR